MAAASSGAAPAEWALPTGQTGRLHQPLERTFKAYLGSLGSLASEQSRVKKCQAALHHSQPQISQWRALSG